MTADGKTPIKIHADDSENGYFSGSSDTLKGLNDDLGKKSLKKKTKDVITACLYTTVTCGSFFACMYFIINRNRFYRIDTMDSWGNKCGRPNIAIDGVPQSGRNMTDQKYTFFFSTISLKKVMLPEKRSDQHYIRLCVKQCPDKALTCSQLVQENGYSAIQPTIDKYGSCEAYQNTILPHYTGDYTCVPKVIHTINGEDQTFESDFSRGFHSMTIGCISNFDQFYGNLLKITALCSLALAIAYSATVLIRHYPAFAVYYLFFVAIHAALISAVICWLRVLFIRSGKDPNHSNNIDQFLARHKKTPVSVYGGSGSYMVTTTHSIDEIFSISSMVDHAAYNSMGTIMTLILLMLSFTAVQDLRPVRVKMICLMVQMVNYILPRAPLLALLPVICLWPHLCLYNFWTVLSYFIYLPKRLWRDEESGFVILDSAMPVWQSAILFWMTYIFWWIADTAHCAQRLFTVGCVSELYFSENGLRPNARGKVKYKRWIKRLYFVFGQICAFSFVNTFGAIIQIITKILRPFGIHRYRPCELISDAFCGSCGDDWEPIFAMDNRALVAVAIFGDSFYVAVRRTNMLLDRQSRQYRESLDLFDTLMLVVRFGTASTVTLMALITELPPTSFGEYDSLTIPYITCFLLSSTVAKSVMNTYTAIADAVYLCYCIDMEVNDSEDFPYYAPPLYKKIVGMVEDLEQEAIQAKKEITDFFEDEPRANSPPENPSKQHAKSSFKERKLQYQSTVPVNRSVVKSNVQLASKKNSPTLSKNTKPTDLGQKSFDAPKAKSVDANRKQLIKAKSLSSTSSNPPERKKFFMRKSLPGKNNQ